MTPRVLHPIALGQLRAWQEIALDWRIHFTTDGHARCANCGTSVFEVRKGDLPYSASPGMLLDATVSHLRLQHRDRDPDKEDTWKGSSSTT